MGHIREDSSGKSGGNPTKDERFHFKVDTTLRNIAKGFLNNDIAKENHKKEAQKTEISQGFEFFGKT
jgi:hypothetical protein